MGSLRSFTSFAVLVAFFALAQPQSAFTHGEQLEVGGGPKGPVSLTRAQTQALGLKLVAADLRPLAELLRVNGTVAVMPDAQADVSLRISGRVTALYAKLGDVVRKDDKLALVESRTVGNPPPTVAVSAPIAGVVDAQRVIIGQAVEPDTTLFHISERTRMRVIGKVYEEDIGKVRAGQSARIYLLAYPGKVFPGRVTLLSPILDPESRTNDVWIELANPDNFLKPDMFAEADIVLGETTSALAVPNDAILEASGEHFVFVREGQKYRRTDISVGASDDQFTQVTSGLVPGDEVVTQGVRELYTLWLTGGQLSAEE